MSSNVGHPNQKASTEKSERLRVKAAADDRGPANSGQQRAL